jgi:divalent metal cation (Fe/Co/Zn/Cd) transporter
LWLIIEALGTIGVGILLSSLSLITFGSDSIIELLSSTIVLSHLRSQSNKFTTFDKKVERITAYLLVSLIPVIALTAFYSYFVRSVPEASSIGIILTFISIPITLIMWKKKSKIGKEINCTPLITDASESAICVLMAVTTLGGLLINYFFNIHWIDYVATGIMLLFIAKEAKEALSKL